MIGVFLICLLAAGSVAPEFVFAQTPTPTPLEPGLVAESKGLTTEEDEILQGKLTANLGGAPLFQPNKPSGTFFFDMPEAERPVNGSIVKFNQSTGDFSYKPKTDFIGNDIFRFTVNRIANGSIASLPADVSITVTPEQTIPTEWRASLAFVIAFVILFAIVYSISRIIRERRKGTEVRKRLGLGKYFYDIVLDENWYPSLALFQFLLWTFIISFAFLGIYLTRILGGYSGIPVEIPVNLLIIMGISVSVPVINTKASDIRYRKTTITKERPDSPPPLSTMLEENGKITLTRFQMFAWTWIGIVVYLFILYSTVSTTNDVRNLFLPDLATTFVVLMGLSQGSYLSGKIVTRQDMEITQIYPEKQGKGKPVSIYGSNFGNTPETIWINNVRIRGDSKENNKDVIENWSDNRIDMLIPTEVKEGQHAVKVGRGGAIVTSATKLEVIEEEKKTK